MAASAGEIDQFPELAAEKSDGFSARHGALRIGEEAPDLMLGEGVGTLELVLPFEIQLGFLRDGRLRLHDPLNVTIMSEDDQVVAAVEEVNEFGYGENPTDAIIDLQHVIAELYFTLEEDHDRLGKGLQAVWEVLQAKIQRR